jgi:predicted transcriptional regulator
MGLEELFDDIRALPPGELPEVVDMVTYLRTRTVEERNEEASAHAMMEAIEADPVQRAALQEDIRRGREEHARGETYEMDEVFAELLGEAAG